MKQKIVNIIKYNKIVYRLYYYIMSFFIILSGLVGYLSKDSNVEINHNNGDIYSDEDSDD